jgi:MYXO-CTERM domain-containing protein
MRKLHLTSALGVASFLLASVASAAAPTGWSTSGLELRDGSSGAISQLFDASPRSVAGSRGLRTLRADLGSTTRGMWREATGVPSHLWGFSIPTSSDDGAVHKLAIATIERHLATLAPGATMGDLVLALDRTDASTGLRKVVFQQRWRGLPVIDASVSASFKNGRLFGLGSRALPHVDAPMPATFVEHGVARDMAEAWASESSALARGGEVDGPFVLPFDDHGALAFRVVLRVVVEAKKPVGRFAVYVDAGTGEPIARKQLLHFETANLELEAWERSPSFGDRVAYDADRVGLVLGESQATNECSPEGAFSFNPEAPQGRAILRGSHVEVANVNGEDATFDFEAVEGETLRWSEASEEERDAQLVAYVHAGIAKDYARAFAPDLGFLERAVEVFVNEDDVCNAYSDGTEIHFYAAGSGCENTARIADVVYHEYGHSLHCHTFRQNMIGNDCIPDGALSEGTSDYFAATITGDHGMGRGFFYDASPLRDVDPETDRVWPNDLVGESHYDGEIIGGTLWDLRKQLILDLGEEEGVATADRLYHRSIAEAYDIPSMYPEMLLADDDDGDLANGTPHHCAINAAFARHGLRPIETTTSIPALTPPTQAGADVAIGFGGLAEECGESLSNAYLTWSDVDEPGLTGTMSMTVREDGLAHATIPTKRDGQRIVFDVTVQTSAGAIGFPNNPADPQYQLYVGTVTPLYCTDFESDPFAAGWAHELISGVDEVGADDWMWGPPGGDGTNGDAMVAFGGNHVVGQDLSPEGDQPWDGHYKGNRHTALISPVIAAGGFANVRLQYRRWLNVEDGYFDQATILANGQPAWQNLDSNQGDQGSNVHHQDREWRFHDVDLTRFLDADGNLQIRFEMRSDPMLQLGGWTIDDFCIVGTQIGCVGAQCAGTPDPAPQNPNPAPPPNDGDDADAAAEDDGCNCEVRGASRGPSTGAWLAAVAVAAVVARRRRR